MTLKPNTHLRQPTQAGLCSGANGFLGQRIRESFGNKGWVHRTEKTRPGVVRSVVTTKDFETVIIISWSFLFDSFVTLFF